MPSALQYMNCTANFALQRILVATLAFVLGDMMLNQNAGSARGNDKKRLIEYRTAVIGSETIDVAIYRPRTCDGERLMLVFHGYERDATTYLKSARRIGRELCLTVIAPRFEVERFPSWRYQRAGVKRSATGIDLSLCIGPLIAELVEWARRVESRPDAEVILFGHSAGAQMLSRVAAYCPLDDPRRIVIANPSSYVTPSMSERVPYGFKAIGDKERSRELLRRYLEQPITIYLGTSDVGVYRLLMNRAAMRQGENRHARGVRIFEKATRIAQLNGWKLNWRLVEASGVGHSVRDMLRAPEAARALEAD